jgi:hypothetical protein
MKTLCTFVMATLGLVSAQGFIDYIELADAPGTDLPVYGNIHVSTVEQVRACQASGDPFACNPITIRPYLPEEAAEKAQEGIEEAWDVFFENYTDTTDAEINKKPYCYKPPVCLPVAQPIPVPEPSCIAARLIEGKRKGLAQHQPKYWQDVTTALLTHLPNTIFWGQSLATGGTATAPIFSVLPKPQQYSQGYSEDVREVPYYTNGVPPWNTTPIPYLPEEVVDVGVTPLENVKPNFEAATLLEYQNFGFSTFYMVRPELQTILTLDADLLPPELSPGVQIYCTLLLVDIPLPVKIPIPSLDILPVAATSNVSVGEGYFIPHTSGSIFDPTTAAGTNP